MGYSIWEFHDDYIKGHEELDDMLKNFETIQDERERRYGIYTALQMLRKLAEIEDDTDMVGAVHSALREWIDWEALCIITQDRVIGELPQTHTLTITAPKEE